MPGRNTVGGGPEPVGPGPPHPGGATFGGGGGGGVEPPSGTFGGTSGPQGVSPIECAPISCPASRSARYRSHQRQPDSASRAGIQPSNQVLLGPTCVNSEWRLG
jgi:hypothetical protein